MLLKYALVVMAFSIGGCVQHASAPSHQRAISGEPSPVVVLPSTTSAADCLGGVEEARPGSVVEAALVLYCHEHARSEEIPVSKTAAALELVARFAYDSDQKTFRNRSLTKNIEVAVPIQQGAEFFLDDTRPQPVPAGQSRDDSVAVVVIRRTARDDERNGEFYPPEGVFEPVELSFSVVLSFDKQLTIQLKAGEPCRSSNPACALAAESAYLRLLSAAELGTQEWIGFTEPQNMTRHTDGIYLIERYDPARIPVLMIHGLQSSPLAWKALTQAILADAELHDRYQIWHAFYPTGLPPFYTGSRVRMALREVSSHFDPEGTALASRHMAVIGHSMGGLVSHMLTSEDDGQLWRETFTVPAEDLPVDDDVRAEFERIFTTAHEPQIGFVAFVGTPHRGSAMATSAIGRVGSALVALPTRFTSLFSEQQAYLDYTTDAMYPILQAGGPDSVRVLRPDHPLLRVLARVPVVPGVEHVSVIGVLGGEDCLSDPICVPTDGVVPYRSAQFARPEDEIVIDAGHNVQEHPEAVEFLTRRLSVWMPASH